MFRPVLLSSLAALAWLTTAAAQQGGDEAAPILRIEAGMHGAVINRIAVDEAAQSLVTVSDDKTTRVWSLADGTQQRVWRTPIGNGDAGALYALALHGDDLVVGGYTGSNNGAIYVFNMKTGVLRGTIDKFKGAITSLAFSGDGHFLAIADEGVSLTLIDFAAMKPKAVDKSYAARINRIAFSPDGNLATTSQDGEIRVLDGSLKELARAKLPTAGDKPWGLAFSPESSQLVVGNRDHPELEVYGAHDLKPLLTLHGGDGTAGDLSVAAWSADGKLLAAAGSYRRADGTRLVRFWPIDGGKLGTPRDTPVASDTVTDLAMLSTDEVAFSTAEPSFGILDQSGKQRLVHRARHPDFRDGSAQFLLSADGATVQFPTAQGGKGDLRFDLIAGALSHDTAVRGDLKPPVVDDAKLKPTDWLNGTAPKLAGKPVTLEPNEHSRALAMLPGGTGAVFGTDFYLRAESATGETWKTVVPAPVWVVNASGDGRYVVAGLGDGTVRWYGSADGHEVMSLFVDPADSRWVAWLPEGFFDHSQEEGKPGGETLVGYQINRGANKLADFVAIGQLYAQFARRDLVLARFRGDAAQAKLVDSQVSRTGDFRAVLKTGLPPKVKLLAFCIVEAKATDCPAGTGAPPDKPDQKSFDAGGSGTTLFARYEIDDRGGGLGNVVVRRNNAAIEGTRKVEREDAKLRVETVLLPLKPDANTVTFSTLSANGSIESPSDETLTVTAKPTAVQTAATGDTLPTLYAVVAGVSEYRQPDFKLANADSDAKAVAEVLSKPSPPVYGKSDVKLLVNEDATRDKIVAAIKDVAAHAQPVDIVIIYLAGHGEAVDNKYYYATVEFATAHPAEVDEAKHSDQARQAEIIDNLFREDGLGSPTLFPLFSEIQGNMLIVLDTCFSASAAVDDAVMRQAHSGSMTDVIAHDTGRFVLTGARKEALDSPGANTGTVSGNHGLFTYWLLQGLTGKDPDVIRKGKIDVVDLMSYTKDQVAEESRKINEEQVPQMQLGGHDRFAVRAAGGS
ncbi:MAG TPA: caspase family protein [Stellaceae bacterium]|nr:caspase family protein [Stellaceae bacterium]